MLVPTLNIWGTRNDKCLKLVLFLIPAFKSTLQSMLNLAVYYSCYLWWCITTHFTSLWHTSKALIILGVRWWCATTLDSLYSPSEFHLCHNVSPVNCNTRGLNNSKRSTAWLAMVPPSTLKKFSNTQIPHYLDLTTKSRFLHAMGQLMLYHYI